MTYASFSESRSLPMLTAEYHDGTIERQLLDDTVNPTVSLRSWKLSMRLIASLLVTVRAFFESHQGVPFFWYHPLEVAPGQAIGSNYDPVGNSIQGRHVCIFRSPQWAESVGLARTDISLEIAEVA